MTESASVQGTMTTLRIPPRVLLVGRSLSDAAGLAGQLIDEGCLVVSEVNVASAVARLRIAKVAFVLLDLDGAGAGGAEVVATRRGDSQREGLPVVVTSRSDDRDAHARTAASEAHENTTRE